MDTIFTAAIAACVYACLVWAISRIAMAHDWIREGLLTKKQKIWPWICEITIALMYAFALPCAALDVNSDLCKCLTLILMVAGVASLAWLQGRYPVSKRKRSSSGVTWSHINTIAAIVYVISTWIMLYYRL